MKTTEEIRGIVQDIADKINAGDITVITAFDPSLDVQGYIAEAQPK